MILAPGDLRIGLADHDELFVVIIEAGAVADLLRRAVLDLLVASVGGAGGVADGVAVAPYHGEASVGIRIRAAAGAAHAQLLTVIDEGRAGTQQIEVGRHLHPPAGHGQKARGAVHVVVGDEGHDHRIGPDILDTVQIRLDIGGVAVYVPGLCGLGDDAAGLGGSKVEAVGGGIVHVGDAVAVPHLRDGVEVGLDLSQLVQIPLPERQAPAVVPKVDVFGGVEAKAVHAQVQIVLCYVHHGGAGLRAVEVQLRHIAGEVALVIILRAGQLGIAAAAALTPCMEGVEVIVGVRDVLLDMRRAEAAEPLVFRACVVDGQVKDQPDVPLMAQGNQVLQILLRAEGGVDGVIICHVVFVIGGGLENRREPDALHAKAEAGVRVAVVEIIKAVDDPAQIADAVSVRIGEGADEDLVKHAAVVLRLKAGAQRLVAEDDLAVCGLAVLGCGILCAAAQCGGTQQQRAQQHQNSLHRKASISA